MTQRKGILAADGSGTRLHPATLTINEQLQTIYRISKVLHGHFGGNWCVLR
jgi:UTP-glucose-1-phosphate uridylyltransferase